MVVGRGVAKTAAGRRQSAAGGMPCMGAAGEGAGEPFHGFCAAAVESKRAGEGMVSGTGVAGDEAVGSARQSTSPAEARQCFGGRAAAASSGRGRNSRFHCVWAGGATQ